MHNAALADLGLAGWRYQLLPIPPEAFADTVRALPEAGFRGINVTIPHKEAALALAPQATPRAEAIGAANLLIFEDDGVISADNTDAEAIARALPVPLAGKHALVLGAGGSARAAVWALRQAEAHVRIWNRTPERARTLAEQLGGVAVNEIEPADVLVNCTPVGLNERDDGLKQLSLKADGIAMYGCVIDLVYSPSETALVRAARRAGIPAVDGLELLVAQGLLGFERFTGVIASAERMAAAARAG